MNMVAEYEKKIKVVNRYVSPKLSQSFLKLQDKQHHCTKDEAHRSDICIFETESLSMEMSI
jgi:hypothetical protein